MLLFVPFMDAQKLHKIIFGHTTDSRIGEMVVIDMEKATNEIDEIGVNLNYEIVPYIYVGDECSKENLEKVLSSLSVASNDVVVFYYSGHGGHAQGGQNDPWPQMCLNKPQFQEYYYPLRKVIETITAKNPHFALILSDCCNNIDETGTVTVKSVLKGAKESTTIDDNTRKNYVDLFTQYKGVLPMTSSKLTQTSGGNAVDGSFFTTNFFDALYEAVSGTSPTWKTITDNAIKNTVATTTDRQEPACDLSNVQYLGGGGSVTPIGTTVTTTTPPAEATTSQLEQALSNLLANSNVESRLSSISSILQQCFANTDVYVMTVGRNLTTVVDTESATTFLRRIAQDRKMKKINIIKESKDSNGKCTYLKVHEVKM